MFQTILVPLDGSLRAERALPMAARIAQNSGARLVLVRVVSFVSEYWPGMATSYPSLAQAAVETDLAEAATYLEQVASSPVLTGLSVQPTVQFGPIAPTILSVASSYQADLIVLCSHGSAGMIHWVMGSVAEKIARHATLPVLVLREEGTHLGSTPADLARPLRMLVPLDGSTNAQAALGPGAALLLALAAPGQRTALHLARVIEPQVAEPQQRKAVSQNPNKWVRAKHSLQQTVEHIREGILAPGIAELGIPINWSILQDTDVASALLRVAEQGEETEFGGCDLIAMATHGRSGFQRWVLGSITERMLHATTRPILIVHPPTPSEWREPLFAGERRTPRSALYG